MLSVIEIPCSDCLREVSNSYILVAIDHNLLITHPVNRERLRETVPTILGIATG